MIETNPRTTVFELAPDSAILSVLVKPLRVVFRTSDRQVLRYERPVPTQLEVKGKLESFDALIEYSNHARHFR
jgi:hypothetical protein